MERQIALDRVDGPQGQFVVSTIRTDAGGADAVPAGPLSPFSSADYVDDTPWPFETMVFKAVGERGTSHTGPGLYHEPHRTEQQAREGHAYAVSMCRAGMLTIGSGVTGPFGNPSTTPEEWQDRITATPSA